MVAERSRDRAPTERTSGAPWCFTTAAIWVLLACGFGLTAAYKLLDPAFMGRTSHHAYPVIRTGHTHSMLVGALLCTALGVTAALGDPRRRRPACVIAATILASLGLVGGLIAVSLGGGTGVQWSEMPPWAELLTLGLPLAGVLTARSAQAPGVVRSALIAGHAVIAAAQVTAMASPWLPRVAISAGFTTMGPHVLFATGLFLVAAGVAENVHAAVARDVPGRRFAALLVGTLLLGPILSLGVTNAAGSAWIAWTAGATWCFIAARWMLRATATAVRHAALAVTDIAWRHMLLGAACLGLLLLQSAITTFPGLRDLLASTDVRIAHAHLGLAGVVVPWLLAGTWQVLDQNAPPSAQSHLARELGFWSLAAGVGGMVFSLLVAGVGEAQAMSAMAPFSKVVASAHDAWWMRLASGAAMTLGLASEAWALCQRTREARSASSGGQRVKSAVSPH